MLCTSSSARSVRALRTGPAAIPGSSSSARARETRPRWLTSSSSTTCRARKRPVRGADHWRAKLAWSEWEVSPTDLTDGRPERTAKAGADTGNHDAGERHYSERSDEGVLEEAPAEVGEEQELESDYHDGGEEGHVVVRDQERKRVEDPPEERPGTGDRAADDWISSAGQLTGIRKPLGKAHADRRPERGRQARDEGIAGVVRRQGNREDRRQCRERAVDQSDHRWLNTLEQEHLAVAHTIRVYQMMCKCSYHKASLTSAVRIP